MPQQTPSIGIKDKYLDQVKQSNTQIALCKTEIETKKMIITNIFKIGELVRSIFPLDETYFLLLEGQIYSEIEFQNKYPLLHDLFLGGNMGQFIIRETNGDLKIQDARGRIIATVDGDSYRAIGTIEESKIVDHIHKSDAVEWAVGTDSYNEASDVFIYKVQDRTRDMIITSEDEASEDETAPRSYEMFVGIRGRY